MNGEQKKRISEYRQRGIAYAVIADRLGLTKDQVSSYCRRNGLAGRLGTRQAEFPDNCCRNCGKKLEQTPGVKKRRFCCPECRVQWWNTHQDKVNRKAVYSFVCPHCGKEFTAYGNAGRKYCSHACYIANRFHHE